MDGLGEIGDWYVLIVVFFQAEDGIRDLVRSRGLGDVYKRQNLALALLLSDDLAAAEKEARAAARALPQSPQAQHCLLYTSDAADERSSVDLGGRRIIKKKKPKTRRLGQSVTPTSYIQLTLCTDAQQHTEKYACNGIER